MRSTADRLLNQLKRCGPQPVAALAAGCAITPMGAHKQLQALAAQGWVAFVDESQGVGRPRRVFSLTAAGHARFPDRHADLTAQLLRLASQAWGPQALDALVLAREQEAVADHLQRLQGASGLGARVARLAEIRRQDGYMARAETVGDGWLLVEDHCPVCTAARLCPGLCRSELALFQRCLGPGAQVERCEHLLAGARRCAYRITPTP